MEIRTGKAATRKELIDRINELTMQVEYLQTENRFSNTEFLVNQKIKELEDTINELSQMYNYYIKKHDFASLDNISRQLYRNKYALDILKDLL